MGSRRMASMLAILAWGLMQPIGTARAQVPGIAPGLRLEGRILAGGGLDDHIIGQTTDGDEITMSGGGGIGLQGLFSFSLLGRYEGAIGVGYLESSLTPEVQNAKGTFGRIFADATFKYLHPLSSRATLKLGVGAGYYLPGDLDLDTRTIPGGAHNIFGFDAATGFHLLAEYERSINDRFSWSFGLGGTFVSYDMSSASSDGIDVPLSLLPPDIFDELGRLDGGSVDLTFSILWRK